MTEQNTAHGDPMPDYEEPGIPWPVDYHTALEPVVRDWSGLGEERTLSEGALLSAAMSLKRIADTLSGAADKADFGQLTNLAWELGRSFQGGMGARR